MKRIISTWIVVTAVSLLIGCQTTGNTRPDHVAPDPKAAEINMRLGLNYLQRGDYEIALQKLQKALRQNPNLASAHNTIALLYQRLDEMKKAESHFKEAVIREPKYSEAQNNYGVFLCQQGRYDEAEQHFLEAIKNPLYSSPAQALENAAMCASRIPDNARAEELFRQALRINPTLSKSLLWMADLSYQQQDYLQSRAYIERYQSVASWSAQALLLAIKTENQLDDQNAVSSYILLLKERFPDSEEVSQVKKGQY
ncbi:MAG: type IV pilus biogenesis/stability protein PilW [Gammaproteobacteria bacterium]|nr:type IV pilus biogenesis/stability protein PilW [Gammaproteobacteria bacterium]MDH5591340.1 type IV pilus biogenesis/stability protein PilW [Gammaproteobacteria bacterium]